MANIVAEAFFCKEIKPDGRRMCLVKSNNEWVWKDEKQIVNLNSFPINENPLTNLLNGKSNESFSIKKFGHSDSEDLDFNFSEDQGKVFVVDTEKTKIIEVPTIEKLHNEKKNSDGDENPLTPYTLESLYLLGEKVAVDE